MSDELRKAQVLIELGRDDAARDALGRILAVEPEDALALTMLALLCRRADDGHRSAELCRAALRVAPEFEWAWRSLAISELLIAQSIPGYEWPERVRRRTEARRAALRAVELDPNDSENHRVLAVVLEDDDAAGALRVIEHAIELDPENADLHVARGSILRRYPGGTAKQAEAALLEALRIDPEHVDALHELALNSMSAGQAATAAEQLRAVARLDPARGDRVREHLALADRAGGWHGAVMRASNAGSGFHFGRNRLIAFVVFVVLMITASATLSARTNEPSDSPRTTRPSTTFRLPPTFPSDYFIPPRIEIPEFPSTRVPLPRPT